jgi:hypothetical protein
MYAKKYTKADLSTEEGLYTKVITANHMYPVLSTKHYLNKRKVYYNIGANLNKSLDILRHLVSLKLNNSGKNKLLLKKNYRVVLDKSKKEEDINIDKQNKHRDDFISNSHVAFDDVIFEPINCFSIHQDTKRSNVIYDTMKFIDNKNKSPHESNIIINAAEGLNPILYLESKLHLINDILLYNTTDIKKHDFNIQKRTINSINKKLVAPLLAKYASIRNREYISIDEVFLDIIGNNERYNTFLNIITGRKQTAVTKPYIKKTDYTKLLRNLRMQYFDKDAINRLELIDNLPYDDNKMLNNIIKWLYKYDYDNVKKNKELIEKNITLLCEHNKSKFNKLLEDIPKTDIQNYLVETFSVKADKSINVSCELCGEVIAKMFNLSDRATEDASSDKNDLIDIFKDSYNIFNTFIDTEYDIQNIIESTFKKLEQYVVSKLGDKLDSELSLMRYIIVFSTILILIEENPGKIKIKNKPHLTTVDQLSLELTKMLIKYMGNGITTTSIYKQGNHEMVIKFYLTIYYKEIKSILYGTDKKDKIYISSKDSKIKQKEDIRESLAYLYFFRKLSSEKQSDIIDKLLSDNVNEKLYVILDKDGNDPEGRDYRKEDIENRNEAFGKLIKLPICKFNFFETESMLFDDINYHYYYCNNYMFHDLDDKKERCKNCNVVFGYESLYDSNKDILNKNKLYKTTRLVCPVTSQPHNFEKEKDCNKCNFEYSDKYYNKYKHILTENKLNVEMIPVVQTDKDKIIRQHDHKEFIKTIGKLSKLLDTNIIKLKKLGSSRFRFTDYSDSIIEKHIGIICYYINSYTTVNTDSISYLNLQSIEKLQMLQTILFTEMIKNESIRISVIKEENLFKTNVIVLEKEKGELEEEVEGISVDTLDQDEENDDLIVDN